MRFPAKDVISVDGSYAVLWKSPMLPVGLVAVRIATVSRRYDPANVKIIVINDEWKDKFDAVEENDGESSYVIEGDETDEILDSREGPKKSATQISDKADHLMEEMEIQTIERVAGAREGVVILKDGPLRLPKAHRMSRVKEVMEIAEQHGNVIAGISKDSRERRINGAVSDESILGAVSSSRPGITGYYPQFEGNDEFGAGQCFARFHPRALKWFRVDFQYNSPMGIGEILQTIACYSQVNTTPGTTFPLMVTAHEIAVKIRQLKPSIEPRIMQYLKDEGFEGSDILHGLTDVAGKLAGGTHHDYLDNFTRVSRAGDR